MEKTAKNQINESLPEAQQPVTDAATFEELNVQPETLKALKKMGFTTPTPIQSRAIAPIMDGRDLIAKAPTGTGKTCAFGIPLIECLNVDMTDVQALVLCPTRELCVQIAEDLRRLTMYRRDVRIAAIYGGQSMNTQIATLKKHPHIVVATPGRLLDHMGRRTIRIDNVYTAVLDEADEMLRMGFIRDVRKILDATPADTQVLMFSATISRDVMDVAWEYQRNAVQIEVQAEGDNRPNIRQIGIRSQGQQRLTDMEKIIDALELKRVIVFANMKSTVRVLGERLRKNGRSCDYLNGDLPQGQRNKVMAGFKKGAFEILVATDVAARGIDVDDVEAVFNYDIPDENEYYLHRIGRRGRARRHGIAITFIGENDEFRMRDIRKYCHADIQMMTVGEDGSLTEVEEQPDEQA